MNKRPPAVDPLEDFEIDDDFLETISSLAAEDSTGDAASDDVTDAGAPPVAPATPNFMESALSRTEAALSADGPASLVPPDKTDPVEASDMSALKFADQTFEAGAVADAPVTIELDDIEIVDAPAADVIELKPDVLDEPIASGGDFASAAPTEDIQAASSGSTMPVLAGAAGLDFDPDTVDVSIPRIAVHIFAERQDTLAAAERAAQDRRMSRATTQVRVGGIAAAIETYQNEPTPPLILVECMKDARTLLTEIDQLAEVCDAGTKVLVVGAANDILLYRELMRRGVSEYLVAPIQPLQLIAAIGGLFTDPDQPFIGRTIAFVGARGGSGSSSVAHNTAFAMSERIGVNTVIVDYDLPFGTSGLNFNQDPIGGVADALSQPQRLDATLLDRMMVRCTDRLSLFAAPATLDADWDIDTEAFDEVTNRIRSTAPFVVLDLPHLWSGWMRSQLVSADEVVLVATPDLASLRNAKNLIDLIKQARPNDAPPRVILNQVGIPGRPEIPAKEFGQALGIHPALSIPFDAKVFGSAANNGQMILDSAAKTKAAEAFETLAQIVSQRQLPAAPAHPRKTSSGLAGLFKRR
ncbi:AAA family ATPase [Brevundimonas pishanensis]|uniref:AAA family ATPase n=1 Tax=Brevundimonas pishanensis TaxID=2896315 RepID=UPI001FA77B0D|nr:cellulose synthase operon protein YhjQ/BcsQ [Brevundimonas pishanensis]